MFNTLRLCLAVMLLCCFISADAGELPPRFTLSVTVVDSVTHLPLEAASITIAETRHNSITSAGGVAVFDSLPAGFYTVQCMFVGYHSVQKSIWVDHHTSLVIELCPESYHLHELEIKAHADDLHDMTIQSRQVLEARQIEQTRGLNIADQLKQLSGVTLMSTGPAITKPVIRGLHSNRLVTVNNGIRQEGQQWGADHGTEIDPFAPSKIEVIKGAASVEYGAEAIGGVIRISPRAFRTHQGMDGELQTTFASNNSMGAGSLLLEGAHFNQHKLSWNARVTTRKAGDSRAPGYVMSNTGFEELDASYAVHYNYKQLHAEVMQSSYHTTSGILRASHSGNTTDLLHAIATGEPTFRAPFTYRIDKPKQEIQHQVSALKVYYLFKQGGRLLTQVSLQNNQRSEYDRPASWASAQNEPAYYLLLKTTLAEVKYEHAKWNNIRGHWGLSWMNQGNVTRGVQPVIPNFRAYTYGIYLIEKYQKGRWVAEAGVRYDHRKQTRFILVKNQVEQDSRLFGNVTFSTGVSYQLYEHLKIQGNVSSAWRPPGINELYSYGLHGGTASFETGNDALRSERSYNTEVGILYADDQWSIETNIYRNTINGFIYREPLPFPTITVRGAFPQFRFVQHDVILQGTDLTINRNAGRFFVAGITAAFLDAYHATTHSSLIYMPANRMRLSLEYRKATLFKLKEVFVNTQVNYVARQNKFPEGMDYAEPPSAYCLLDFNLGFENHIGKQTMRWSLSIFNTLNTSYRDYLSRFRYYTDDPGINVMVRLAVPFSIITKH